MRLPVAVTGATAEVRYLETGADTLVFAFNHSKLPIEPAIALRLGAGNYRGADLVTGKPVELSEQGDAVNLHGRIAPEDVWVVDISPR